MHTSFHILLTSSAIFFSANALAQDNCAVKKQNLQQQINYAQKYGNTEKLNNLKRALANVDLYCQSNNRHKNDTPPHKIVQKCELDVLNAQRELKKAEIDDDFDNMQEKQDGLRHAQYRLSEAKAGFHEH